jgi:hypothetical protein
MTTVTTTDQLQGTYLFNADGTFTVTAAGSSTQELTNALACYGTATTCDDVTKFLQSQFGSTLKSVSCLLSGADCVCTLSLVPTTTSTSGQYSVSGGVLTLPLSSSSGVAQSMAYCVNGQQLTLSPQAAPNSGGSNTTTGSILLTKQ